jgi:hypothetical protein
MPPPASVPVVRGSAAIPRHSHYLQTCSQRWYRHGNRSRHRYKSGHKPGTQVKAVHEQDPPYYILLTTYLSYLFLICLGHVRDSFGKCLHPVFYRHLLPFDVSCLLSECCSWPGIACTTMCYAHAPLFEVCNLHSFTFLACLQLTHISILSCTTPLPGSDTLHAQAIHVGYDVLRTQATQTCYDVLCTRAAIGP